MDFSRELLFFFSALGAFNGLLLGTYFLLFAQPRHLSNRFLGAFLIALSIRIGKSVFFYFQPDLAFIYLQLGLSACLFVGPFLYCYFQSITGSNNKIERQWKYHIFPYLLLALVVGILFPFEQNIELWRNYFINLIYTQWFFYLLLSSFRMQEIIQRFKVSENKWKSHEIWILSIFFGSVFIWLAYNYCGYTSYILGALSFSFMLYLLILLLVLNKKKNPYFTKPSLKYADKRIASQEAKQLLEQLSQIMTTQELYKSPNLKLPDVAKQMNLLPHRLSQLLNDNLGKNFPSFLNEYRIEAAKKMIQIYPDYALEAIGYDCGFNSKSTFYSTFKKLTGTTPAKFKSALESNGD
ncbi:MAG: helix-turn-helix transcriptional regulator [Bacteroidota bacterium]